MVESLRLEEAAEEGAYESLVGSIPIAVLVVDEEGIIKYANEAMQKKVGKMLCGEGLGVLIPPGYRARHDADFLALTENPESSTFFGKWRTVMMQRPGKSDPGQIAVEVCVRRTLIATGEGMVPLFVATVVDASPGTRARMSLSQNLSFLRHALQETEVLVAVVEVPSQSHGSGGGLFVEVSPACKGILGGTLPSPGSEAADVVHSDDRETWRQFLLFSKGQVVDDVGVSGSVDVRLRNSTRGVYRNVRVVLKTGRRTSDGGGVLLGVQLLDLTEQRERLEQLQSLSPYIHDILEVYPQIILVGGGEDDAVVFANRQARDALSIERALRGHVYTYSAPWGAEKEGCEVLIGALFQQDASIAMNHQDGAGPDGGTAHTVTIDGKTTRLMVWTGDRDRLFCKVRSNNDSSKLVIASVFDRWSEEDNDPSPGCSQDEYEAITAANDIVAMLCDSSGGILVVSSSVESHLGYTPKQLRGENVTSLMRSRDAQMHGAWMARFMENPGQESKVVGNTLEHSCVHKDGQILQVDISIKLVQRSGMILFEAQLDFSYRKKDLLLELDQKHSIFESVFEHLPAACVFVSSDGVVRRANRAAAEIMRIDSGRMNAMRMDALFFDFEDYGWCREGNKMSHWSDIPEAFREPQVCVGRRGDNTYFRATLQRQMEGTEHTSLLFDHSTGMVESAETSNRDTGNKMEHCIFITDLTRQDEAEEERRSALGKTTAVMDSVHDVMVVSDEQGIIEVVNSASQKLMGWEPEELIGKNVGVLMSEKMAALHQGYLRNWKLLRKPKHMGHVRSENYFAVRKDGSSFPISVLVNSAVINGTHMLLATIRDISAEITHHNEIMKREEQLRCRIDQEVSPVIMMDTSGVITLFNPAACELFGYHIKEVLGRSVDIIMPSDAAKEHNRAVTRYLQMTPSEKLGSKIVGQNFKTIGVTKSGDAVHLLINVSESQVGSVHLFTAVLQDITQTAMHEKSMKMSEEQMKMIVDRASDGIIVTDRFGAITLFNPMAEIIFGHESGEVIGENVSVLMPRPFSSEHSGYMKNYVDGGPKKIIGRKDVQLRGRRKDGLTFDVSISLAEIRVGEEWLFTAVVRDITKWKESMSALEEKIELGHKVLDVAPLPYVCVGPTGIILYCSRQAADILDLPSGIYPREGDDITHFGQLIFDLSNYERCRKAFVKYVNSQRSGTSRMRSEQDRRVSTSAFIDKWWPVTMKRGRPTENTGATPCKSVKVNMKINTLSPTVYCRPSPNSGAQMELLPGLPAFMVTVERYNESPPSAGASSHGSSSPTNMIHTMGPGPRESSSTSADRQLSNMIVARPESRQVKSETKRGSKTRKARSSSTDSDAMVPSRTASQYSSSSSGRSLNLFQINRQPGLSEALQFADFDFADLDLDDKVSFASTSRGLAMGKSDRAWGENINEVTRLLSRASLNVLKEIDSLIEEQYDVEEDQDLLERIMLLMLKHMKWQVAHIFLWDSFEERLRASMKASTDPRRSLVFHDVTYKMRLKSGQGLPGIVFKTKKPKFVVDLSKLPVTAFPRAPYAAEVGVRAVVGCPIPFGDDGVSQDRDVIGIVEFFSDMEETAAAETIRLLECVCDRIGSIFWKSRLII